MCSADLRYTLRFLKTVLYQICKKLSDRMGQAQGLGSVCRNGILNQYLPSLRLFLAVPYEQSFLSIILLLGFDPNKTAAT